MVTFAVDKTASPYVANNLFLINARYHLAACIYPYKLKETNTNALLYYCDASNWHVIDQ